MTMEPIANREMPRLWPNTNAFGMSIPTIREILENPTLTEFIRDSLTDVFAHLVQRRDRASDVVANLIELARSGVFLDQYESEGNRLLIDQGVVSAIPEKLSGRARLIHSQVIPWIIGDRLCDLGCGDGRVGEMVAASDRSVVLADVYRHSHVSSTGLSFYEFSQGSDVPIPTRSVDTTLLLTVLHHADSPVSLLKEGIRITRPGGRVIVIESVFGIVDGVAGDARSAAFCSLTAEEQRHSNIFFDHLYNRVIHFSADPRGKVNVPFNFNVPTQWEILLAETGAPQSYFKHLGVDQPLVPEYHTLHVGTVR